MASIAVYVRMRPMLENEAGQQHVSSKMNIIE